jgi:dephospho-CoA kinase
MDFALALCGEMRCGKDTVAKYLEEQYGFMPFAFGDNLKKGFHYTYPHIPRDPKPVRGYQLYGQLMRYVNYPDYWIDQCFHDIETARPFAKGYSEPFRFVITDMRQPNEFETCTNTGIVTIRIEAPIEVRLERIKAAGDEFDPKNLNFETETHIRGFKVDHIIKNYKDLQYLYDQVDFIMDKYGITKK